MNVIKAIIEDFEALLKRIESEIAPHAAKSTALAHMDQAKAALVSHPDASAAASTIVSPGKEAPTAQSDASAPAASETPANDAPEATAT